MLTDDGKDIKIGKPTVKGAVVSAEILEHGRHPKILVYKKKRRKGYQRKNSHRQDFSSIKVNNIKISTPNKKTPAKKTVTTKKTIKESK